MGVLNLQTERAEPRTFLKDSVFGETMARSFNRDVSPHEFVRAYAAHLKRSGKIELPHWTDLVKTATFKELAPYEPDWYYVRAASMARKMYLRQGIRVGAFRKIYGGSQRNGACPPHFCKTGATVILRNAKIEMLKGSMRLVVDRLGRIEPTDPADFEAKEDNNLSLLDFEMISVVD